MQSFIKLFWLEEKLANQIDYFFQILFATALPEPDVPGSSPALFPVRAWLEGAPGTAPTPTPPIQTPGFPAFFLYASIHKTQRAGALRTLPSRYTPQTRRSPK